MDVDYTKLRAHVAHVVRDLELGIKEPVRNPKVRLDVVRGLQGEVRAGKFVFRTDAAEDAGGFAQHPRPMDYLLGALASCQQMWCLRWAALNGHAFRSLAIEAESVFTWEGEYLARTDAGITELRVAYHVDAPGLSDDDLYDMADTVQSRCPIFATLRRVAPIRESFVVPDRPVRGRQWLVGVAHAQAAREGPQARGPGS